MPLPCQNPLAPFQESSILSTRGSTTADFSQMSEIPKSAYLQERHNLPVTKGCWIIQKHWGVVISYQALSVNLIEPEIIRTTNFGNTKKLLLSGRSKLCQGLSNSR